MIVLKLNIDFDKLGIFTIIYIVIAHFSFQLSIPDNDSFILAKYSTIESCHEVVFGNKLILETNIKLMM